MTPERLAELRALAEAATPGPWGLATTEGMGYAVHRGEHDTIALYCERPDAAFIAAASTAVPELLAEVERLTVERDEWENRADRAGVEADRLRVELDEHRAHYVTHDALATARAEAWAQAIATAERQTNLAELVHFDRPSDFRRGVLTVITALRAAAGQGGGE